MSNNFLYTCMKSKTKDLLEALHKFFLVEEVLEDHLATKQPDVAVVRDGAVREPSGLEKRALCLRLPWTHHKRDPKQLQQLL